MADVSLFFRSLSINDVMVALQGLPKCIRPVYFSEDEGKIKSNKDLLSNSDRFHLFKEKNPHGFFLYSEEKIMIDISVSDPIVGYSSISLDLESLSAPQDIVEAFFTSLSLCQPIFGFAGEWDEYNHRNRYYITIGKNHIESWIGRRLDIYIPGLYWYTLLSDELLNNHHVKLTELSIEAISNESLGDGSLHLLKFYEQPEDWKETAERLDNLCEKVDGVFSRRSVEAAVQGVSNYLEYDEIIANWR